MNEPSLSSQASLDHAPVQHHQAGGGESVDQPYRSLHPGLVEADRVAAGIVQPRPVGAQAPQRGAAEVDPPAVGPQAFPRDVTVDGQRGSSHQRPALGLAQLAAERERAVDDGAGQPDRALHHGVRVEPTGRRGSRSWSGPAPCGRVRVARSPRPRTRCSPSLIDMSIRPEIAHCSASITSPPTDRPEASSAAPSAASAGAVRGGGGSMIAFGQQAPAMRTLPMRRRRVFPACVRRVSIRNMLPSRVASSRLSRSAGDDMRSGEVERAADACADQPDLSQG